MHHQYNISKVALFVAAVWNPALYQTRIQPYFANPIRFQLSQTQQFFDTWLKLCGTTRLDDKNLFISNKAI